MNKENFKKALFDRMTKGYYIGVKNKIYYVINKNGNTECVGAYRECCDYLIHKVCVPSALPVKTLK